MPEPPGQSFPGIDSDVLRERVSCSLRPAQIDWFEDYNEIHPHRAPRDALTPPVHQGHQPATCPV
jgi:hypothetical protein